MLVLGIETSCDETAAAVVRDGKTICSNVIASQVEFHKKYGGVVPVIASRKHLESIVPVIAEALPKADVTLDSLDGIAVTQAPGLVGSLLVENLSVIDDFFQRHNDLFTGCARRPARWHSRVTSAVAWTGFVMTWSKGPEFFFCPVRCMMMPGTTSAWGWVGKTSRRLWIDWMNFWKDDHHAWLKSMPEPESHNLVNRKRNS